MYSENDNEIIFMISETSDDATEYLIKKYTSTIKWYVNKYKNTASSLGIGEEDLYQEGLIALIYAIKRYDVFKNIKFSTFVNTIIGYRINKLILSGKTLKHKILNESLSLDYEYYDNVSLEDYIGEYNLEDDIIYRETRCEIDDHLSKLVSDIDKRIIDYRIDGYSIDDISSMLKIDKKTVNNSLYRTRIKLRKHLKC